MTTPSAEGARPADAGRASSPDSDAADATGTTDAPDSTQDPVGGDTPASADTPASDGAEPLLRLVDIGKSFGPVRVLSHINLDIPPGQVTAVVGDNGAGKSTLIKIGRAHV